MAADESVDRQIRGILVERLFLKVDPGSIQADAPLMETYGIDSVGLLEVVVGLEEVFGITFEEDEEFDVSQFQTVRAIADYVRGKLGESADGA
jgi:acyl carrier protein